MEHSVLKTSNATTIVDSTAYAWQNWVAQVSNMKMENIQGL